MRVRVTVVPRGEVPTARGLVLILPFIYLVINQMDTSQAHLGVKARDAIKPDNLSKDELTAVLKYGAQKM